MKLLNLFILIAFIGQDFSLAAAQTSKKSIQKSRQSSRQLASIKNNKKVQNEEDEDDDTPLEPSQAQLQSCADAAKNRFADLVINEAPRFSQIDFDFQNATTTKINMPDMANDRVGRRRRKVKLNPKPYEPGLRISISGTGQEANGTRTLKAHCIVGRRALVTVTYEFFDLKSNGQQVPTPNNTPAEN